MDELTGKEVETGHILHALGHSPLLGVVLPRSRRSYTSDLLEGTRIAWNENNRVTAWLLCELLHQTGQEKLTLSALSQPCSRYRYNEYFFDGLSGHSTG